MKKTQKKNEKGFVVMETEKKKKNEKSAREKHESNVNDVFVGFLTSYKRCFSIVFFCQQ